VNDAVNQPLTPLILEDQAMNTLTRYLSIALLSLSVIGAQADGHGDKAEYHQQKRFEHMVKQLDLNEQQIAHINNVKDSQQEQYQSLKEDRAALRLNMQALQADFRQQLEGVLSEDQLAKFDNMQQRRQHRMAHKKGDMKQHKKPE
jgi:Spy/CpxP family protein refolding chaperone